MTDKEIIRRQLEKIYSLEDEIEELKTLTTAIYEKELLEEYKILKKAIKEHFGVHFISVNNANINEIMTNMKLKHNQTYQASNVSKGDEV
jgi:hypothetical protein